MYKRLLALFLSFLLILNIGGIENFGARDLTQEISHLKSSQDFLTTPPTKPVIYYTSLVNEKGRAQLTPQLLFPQEMVNQANGLSSASHIMSKLLLMLPENFSLNQLQALCEKKPSVAQTLHNMLESAPELIQQLGKALKGASSSQALTQPEQSDNLLVPHTNQGAVEINTSIHADKTMMIAPGDMILHDSITGDKGLMVSLGKMTIESLKTRINHSSRGWERGYHDVILTNAEVIMEQFLHAYSFQNMTTIYGTTVGKEIHTLETDDTLNSLSLPQEEYHMQQRRGGRDYMVDTDILTHQKVSKHSGKINTIYSKNSPNIAGSLCEGEKGLIKSETGKINLIDVYNLVKIERYKWSSGRGFCGGHSASTCVNNNMNSLGSVIKFTDQIEFESGPNQFITMIRALLDSPKTILRTLHAHLKAGVDIQEISHLQTSQDFLTTEIRWNKWTHQTYHPCEITGRLLVLPPKGLEDQKPQMLVDTVLGQSTPSYVQTLQQSNRIELLENVLKDKHDHEHIYHSQFSPEFLNLVSLVVGALTYEFGGFLIAPATVGMSTTAAIAIQSMASTIVSHLTTQGAISLLNNGDLRGVGSSKSMRSLATSLVTTALIGPSGHGASSLSDRLIQSVVRSTIRSIVETGITGRSFEESLKDNVLNGVVDVGIAHVANKIGTRFKKGEIPRIQQMMSHLGNGAMGGGIKSLIRNEDLLRGIASGAGGALMGEFIGEMFANHAKENGLIPDLSDSRWCGLASGTVAFLLGGDVGIASNMGEITAENNALHKILDVAIIAYDLTELGYGYVVGDETQVKESLKNLGVDLVGTLNPTGNWVGYARIGQKAAKIGGKVVGNILKSNQQPLTITIYGSYGNKASKKPISEMNNHELLQSIATRAEKKIGGRGMVPGTKKHKYSEKLLKKYQEMYGDRGLSTEISYKNGTKLEKGDSRKGSVRLDVYDTKNEIVYDYKFVQNPGKSLRSSQINKIKNQGPEGIKNIIEVNPNLQNNK